MDTFRVKAIQVEATNTHTIFLERTDGQPLSYRAGQFLTFVFTVRGRELRRSYSLSTTPGFDPVPAITVKRITNGAISRQLLDHLQVGDLLESLPPAGMFVLEEQKGREIPVPPENDGAQGMLVFIAAGSGMTPVFSLLKEALFRRGRRVLLISQQHDVGDILFRIPLEQWAEELGQDRFRWVNLLSMRDGRLNNEWLERLVKELLPMKEHVAQEEESPLFYLCGPPAFMRMAQFTLRNMGYAGSQIRKENFTVEYVPGPPLVTDRSPKKIKIRTADKEYQYEVSWPDTILQGGLRHHIPLPYSCRGGRCSTCVARCVKGKVTMSINEVLTQKDLSEGLVLTCVGYAESDVELQFL